MIKKTFQITIWTLVIGIIFIGLSYAEKSTTFSASCYMPYYVTLDTGEKVLADSDEARQKKLDEVLEENENNIDAKESKISGLIRQVEEIISEDNNGNEEMEIIVTLVGK